MPDGMKCDSAGNVWVTAPGGVWVYSRSGALLGKVRVPELVANLHWGKSDWRTLFMCATHSLYAVRTKIGPHIEPFMRARTSDGVSSSSAQTSQPERASAEDGLRLDPSRCALIIQDMQNDVMMDGGAFASSGAPQHAREQNVVENIRRLGRKMLRSADIHQRHAIVAPRHQQYGLVRRCRQDLVRIDASIELCVLFYFGPNRAVCVNPMHSDVARIVVGGEQELAAMIDAGVDRA